MSCLKSPQTERKRHVLIWPILVVFSILLFVSPQIVFAKDPSRKAHEPSTRELVGKDVFNEKYPNGWSYDRPPDAKKTYQVGKVYFTELKKGQWLAYTYEKILEVTPVNGAGGKKQRAQIVDALIVRRRSYPWIFEKAGTCKFSDGTELQGDFVASVNFQRCQRYSTLVEKVWKSDDKQQKISTQLAKGLTCELISFGQDPQTSECLDWGKCYAHFNLARNQIPDFQQTKYCSDHFLLPKWQRDKK